MSNSFLSLSSLEVLDISMFLNPPRSMFLIMTLRLGCSISTNLVTLPDLTGPAASDEDSVHTRQVWSFPDVPDACPALDVPENEL